MKGVAIGLAFVLALTGSALAQQCEPPEHLDKEGRAREGMSVSIGLKLVEFLWHITGGVLVGLTFTTETLDLTYRCTCAPYSPPSPLCCPTYVRATIFTTPSLTGPDLDPYNPYRQQQVSAVLVPKPEDESWRGPWPDPTDPVCHKEHEQRGVEFRGSLTLGIRVGIPPATVSVSLASSESMIWISRVCFCNEREWCQGNRAPTLSGPAMLAIPREGATELVLTATDPNGADDILRFRVARYPAGVSVRRGEVQRVRADTKQATFILSTEVALHPAVHSLEVETVDRCKNKAALKIPVTSAARRPTLRLESSELRGRKYLVSFWITDEDLGEVFLIDVEATGGTVNYERYFPCRNAVGPCVVLFPVTFIPEEGAAERWVTVTVTDRYGLTASSWHNLD